MHGWAELGSTNTPMPDRGDGTRRFWARRLVIHDAPILRMGLIVDARPCASSTSDP
jgi:hypothetical protein